MNLQQFTVSLKTAELATSVMSVMTAVSTLNGVRPPIDRSRRLFQQALADAVFYADDPPPAPPLVLTVVVKPVVYELEESEPEESPWEPSSPRGASCCKALLLEVLRRAAHDWVLYRGHTKLQYRELADDAFVWLFEEDEEHTNFRSRLADVDDGGNAGVKIITSFVAICEALDLDVDVVRDRVRQMDARSITSAGRPAETRRVKKTESESLEEHGVSISVDMDYASDASQTTLYESYGSIETPGRLYSTDLAPG